MRFQGDNQTNISSRFESGQPLAGRFGAGPCFACNLYGDFAKQCPYVQRNTVAPATENPKLQTSISTKRLEIKQVKYDFL
jgi:hypothetical protein